MNIVSIYQIKMFPTSPMLLRYMSLVNKIKEIANENFCYSQNKNLTLLFKMAIDKVGP